MPRKNDRPLFRSTPAQLRTLASPVRIEMVGVLQAHGALSVREIAAHLSRPMDGLYHHLRALQSAEIVRVAATRRAGKRDEAVYELTAERFGHESRPRTPDMTSAVADSAAAALRLANREFARSLAAAPDGCPFPKLSRQRTWLREEDCVKLHKMLGRVETFLAACLRRREGRPYVLTTTVVPVVKRKRV